jgi:CDP-glucose 4,6-dehydratase
MFELVGGADNILSRQLDVSDAAAVDRIFQDFQPEIVFHLAAQSLVRRSYERPWETFMSNVMGTASVLEASRSAPSVRAILIVTSDKVYKNRGTGNSFVESDQLGGDDPYSASKACTELVTESWRTSFFHSDDAARVASARAGNVFGGGDWCADRLLPDIVRAVSAEQAVVLRNPTAVRPWQYVLEALSGYLMLGIRLARGDAGFAEGWNFGPESSEAIDVADFAQRVVRSWGKGSVVLRPDPGAPKEAHTLRLDSAKSMDQLGWKPVLPLEEAIDWSVQWYRKVVADPSSAAEITTGQIQAFSRCLERAGVGRSPFAEQTVK